MNQPIDTSGSGIIAGNDRQRLREILRQRRAELQLLAGQRMGEAQPGSVKEMSLGWQSHQSSPAPATIGVVTDYRMADRREMNANLMGSPRV